MLSEQAIKEFQAIYKKEFGEDISYAEASEKGTKLIRLFKIIYRPIPKGWPYKKGSEKMKQTNTNSNLSQKGGDIHG